jgi:5-methylcytosine-specific restriction endonuclease McrA
VLFRSSKDLNYVNWQKNQYHKRLKEAEGNHTFGEWELLKKQYGYKCPMCGMKEPEIKLTEDHIIPLSKGGSNWIENIQPLCLKCNMKKHNKLIGKIQVTNI